MTKLYQSLGQGRNPILSSSLETKNKFNPKKKIH